MNEDGGMMFDFPVRVDKRIPSNTIEFRDKDGKLVGLIVGIAPPDPEREDLARAPAK